MESASRFDFVVFDWKGTLEPKSGIHEQKEKHAIEVLLQTLDELFHESYQKERKKLEEERKENRTFSKTVLLERTLQALQISSDKQREAIAAFYEAKNTYPSPQKGLYPGAEKVLNTLQEKKIPVALIRNSTLPGEQFQSTIIKCGAEKWFDVEKNVVMSGDVGASKPDKKIFEAIVNKCGQNELHEKHPERILFVGNETALDVVGGNNMGWKTVLIKTTETSSNGLATWDISNLDELLDIIFPT